MTSAEEAPGAINLGVLTADPLRLEGLRQLLEAEQVYRVSPLAEAERSCGAALRLVAVDVAAVDNLESLLQQFGHLRPHLQVLVLGPEAGPEEIMRIIGYGAKGYLAYTATEQELLLALAVLREGSIWAPRKVLARLLARKERPTETDPVLTPREREVLRLLVQGRPNRQIAEALGLDETTVKAHLSRLMRKLNVRNRIALSMQALHHIDPDQ